MLPCDQDTVLERRSLKALGESLGENEVKFPGLKDSWRDEWYSFRRQGDIKSEQLKLGFMCQGKCLMRDFPMYSVNTIS